MPVPWILLIDTPGRQPDLPVAQRRHPVVGDQPPPPARHGDLRHRGRRDRGPGDLAAAVVNAPDSPADFAPSRHDDEDAAYREPLSRSMRAWPAGAGDLLPCWRRLGADPASSPTQARWSATSRSMEVRLVPSEQPAAAAARAAAAAARRAAAGRHAAARSAELESMIQPPLPDLPPPDFPVEAPPPKPPSPSRHRPSQCRAGRRRPSRRRARQRPRRRGSVDGAQDRVGLAGRLSRRRPARSIRRARAAPASRARRWSACWSTPPAGRAGLGAEIVRLSRRSTNRRVSAVRAARFRPYAEGGIAQAVWVLVPINFVLQ